ncbi:MAG TPA: hypothetical protein VJY65_08625, partial [Chloroflexota bacterium]|nr:hypothetical protein [Chloroflexota bacterium]
RGARGETGHDRDGVRRFSACLRCARVDKDGHLEIDEPWSKAHGPITPRVLPELIERRGEWRCDGRLTVQSAPRVSG